jgi:hypothetical protein
VAAVEAAKRLIDLSARDPAEPGLSD